MFYGLTKYDFVEKGSINSGEQLTSGDVPKEIVEDANILSESENVSTDNNNISEASDKAVVGENESTNTGDGYIYYLTNEKIDQAIIEGKTSNFRDDFNLPLLTNTSSGSEFEYMDLFITTPYNLVEILSSNEYRKDDRTITREEAKKIIDYDYISFTAYVLDGWANMFAIELTQDNDIIKAYRIINNTDGDIKSAYFYVKDIDFREPATLKIFDKDYPEKYSEYNIVFKNYVK